jgi:hypothetical protein
MPYLEVLIGTPIAGGGGAADMEKAVYDQNDSGVVDDSEKVNGLTVETAVPVGALFTDTIPVSNVYETNTLKFNSTTGDFYGTHAVPRTGALLLDNTGEVTGGNVVVYYQNSTLDLPFTPLFIKGDSLSTTGINMLFILRDADDNYTVNIIAGGELGDYFVSLNMLYRTYGEIPTMSGLGVGEYMEIKTRFDYTNDTQAIWGNSVNKDTYQLLLNDTNFRGSIQGGTGANATTTALLPNVWYVIRVTNNGTNADIHIDGNLIGQTNSSADLIASDFNQVFRRGDLSDALNIPGFYLDGDVEYLDYNGSMITFNNKTGVHVSDDSAHTLTILSANGTPIDTLYNEII